MYNLRKEEIVQDQYEKIEKETIIDRIKQWYNTNKQEIKDNIVKVLSSIFNIIRLIIKVFPFILLLYPIIQMGLYISKNILPLTPWIDKGWNDTFISHLPYIFQPIGHPWACFSLLIISIFLFMLLSQFFLQYLYRENIQEVWPYILVNIPVMGFLICIFIFTEITIKYCGWIGFVICLITIIYSYNSNGEFIDTSNGLSIIEKEERKESSSKINQPEIEIVKKIVNAKQISNQVIYNVNEFENGRNTGRGNVYGFTGVLQNWNEMSVTVKDGVWFRQYGLRGEIINSWHER